MDLSFVKKFLCKLFKCKTPSCIIQHVKNNKNNFPEDIYNFILSFMKDTLKRGNINKVFRDISEKTEKKLSLKNFFYSYHRILFI
jgi:hypothetical protein